jgi:hypothetical protein
MHTAEREAELLGLAASGEVVALNDLAWSCVLRSSNGVLPFEAYVAAEAFGRLAAATGEADPSMLLAGVLRVRADHVASLGDTERAVTLYAQSEALCDQFPALRLSRGVEFLGGVLSSQAANGDDVADVRLAKLAAALSPEAAYHLGRELDRAFEENREALSAVHV